jgi:alpha-ketoglutarate-dependent taurine dioxygenase
MSNNIQTTRLTTTIGAEISGVNLRSLSESEAERIRRELDKHSVLVFHDQHLNLDEQSHFAEVFGPLEPLQSLKFLGWSHVLVLDGLVTARSERQPTEQWVEYPGWHTDSSFTRAVPRAAVLRAEIIPPVGGMTSWVNMCAAFEALSPTMHEWLKTLRAVHSYPPGYREKIGVDKLARDVQVRFDEEFAPRAHPVVFRHPRSERCGLFVNPTYTTHIVGLSAKESRMLLNFLFTHFSNADFIYRHLWREGDIVVWDELATLHLAPDAADYAPHRRRVVRVTAGLEAPVAA